MNNRDFAISMINENLVLTCDEKLADVFCAMVGVPKVCEFCPHDNETPSAVCDCTKYITKWLQSKDTSKQYIVSGRCQK